MLIILFLLCCCQTSLASQLDDSPVIQALEERIALLELNIDKQHLGASHTNNPLSDLHEKTAFFSETYRHFESKIRILEEKLLDHEEVNIQLKGSKNRIDALEKTVHDLLTIVKKQEKELNSVRELKTKVVDQDRTIADLRKRTSKCESLIFNFQNQLNMFQHSEESKHNVLDSMDKSRGYDDDEVEEQISIKSVHPENREVHSLQKKLLSPVGTTPPTVTTSTTAFYAYMSRDTPAITIQHSLTFDVVKTNLGNGYHPATGVFIAPESGIYVFTWTIRENGNDHHPADLMVNTDVVGALYVSGDGGSSTSTGIVVTHVNAEDDVYVRTTSYSLDNSGVIGSNGAGRSSFAGWKLC